MGRPWPLLTGERGHYEIAAGRDPLTHLRALESSSQGIGLIPEQIWDGPELRPQYLRLGGTTDAAMPLLWAHSEYVKLHRSAADGKVFDLVEPAYDRYVIRSGERKTMEVWKPNRQVQAVPAGTLLRIQADSPFLLHWTSNNWEHSVGIHNPKARGLESNSWISYCPNTRNRLFASHSFGSKKIVGKARITQ